MEWLKNVLGEDFVRKAIIVIGMIAVLIFFLRIIAYFFSLAGEGVNRIRYRDYYKNRKKDE